MTFKIKDFDEHQHEWLDKPTMSKAEVIKYLGISVYLVDELTKRDIITKYLFHRGKRWFYAYDRYEIIAYAHEVGLKT